MSTQSVHPLQTHVCQQIESLVRRRSCSGVFVALSGGMDSTVLLHATAALIENLKPLTVNAIHVDHGIHPDSGAWAEFCSRLCRRLNVPLQVSKLSLQQVTRNREATYRQERYQLFSEHLPSQGILLTAHHQRDQVETVLFNLFRGAGVSGLRGIKACKKFSKGFHLRPLLGLPAEQLLQYAQQHRLEWIDDPSNRDTGLDRNYIRHQILPQIVNRWPGAVSSISRSADLLWRCEQLLNEMAEQDLADIITEDHPGVIKGAYLSVLDISRLTDLSWVRAMNVLKYWIEKHCHCSVTASQLSRIYQDLCSTSQTGLFELANHQIRAYKGYLFLMQSLPMTLDPMLKPDFLNQCYFFKSLRLKIEIKPNQGLAFSFSHRTGGETIRHHRQSKSLKNIFQQKSIPHWERDLIPLIYLGQELIAVPGVVLADDAPIKNSVVYRY